MKERSKKKQELKMQEVMNEIMCGCFVTMEAMNQEIQMAGDDEEKLNVINGKYKMEMESCTKYGEEFSQYVEDKPAEEQKAIKDSFIENCPALKSILMEQGIDITEKSKKKEKVKSKKRKDEKYETVMSEKLCNCMDVMLKSSEVADNQIDEKEACIKLTEELDEYFKQKTADEQKAFQNQFIESCPAIAEMISEQETELPRVEDLEEYESSEVLEEDKEDMLQMCECLIGIKRLEEKLENANQEEEEEIRKDIKNIRKNYDLAKERILKDKTEEEIKKSKMEFKENCEAFK